MWKPVSPDTDLCPKCARTADSDAKVQEGLAAIHKLEKVGQQPSRVMELELIMCLFRLSSSATTTRRDSVQMVFISSLTRTTGSFLEVRPAPISRHSQLTVFTGFGRAWIAWSRAPAKKPRPGPISNTAFLCDHGRLSLDIDVEVDSASLVDAVSIKAWKLLQSK